MPIFSFPARPLRRGPLPACALAVLIGLAPCAAWPQEFPDRPITLIVPFSAGGPTDVTARLFAQAMAREAGKPVIVENRPGAGGATGGGIAARARPDGYTLLWAGTSTLTVAPALYASLPYDAHTSFQPVGRAMTGPLALVVHGKLPARSVADLVALARAKPGTINFGSAGIGSIIHLTGEMFRQRAAIDITHVPYKGNAEVLTDLSAGRLQMAFMALGQVMPQLGKGDIRVLAVTSLDRVASLPGVPTVAESGYPGFESVEWFGLLAPAKTPVDVLQRLQRLYAAVASQRAVADAITALGYVAIRDTPEQFSRTIAQDADKWRQTVATAHVTPQ